MTLSARDIHVMLGKRYPNAEVFVLDPNYDVPERKEVESLYRKFQRALKVHKLLKWTASVWDCENFAWNFKGGAAANRAKNERSLEIPIGFVCYLINGEKNKGHAINNFICKSGKGCKIKELEPQPNAGPFDLTKKERESAWLVVV